jgi:membrane dipeptidase
MSVIAGYRATIAANPERYVLVSSVDDIIQAAADGRIAITFDLEGAMPLLEQPEMVALYAQLGVRQIHFAYNRNNSVADGCHDVPRGLTPLGHRMVQAVNENGILMDCSHTGRLCSLDIMNASSQPVIFSHANPYTLVQHGRNVTDEQIRACAATGGVVCVSGLSFFLGSAQPTADDVARHAAYVADLVGVRTPASVWTSASPSQAWTTRHRAPSTHRTGGLPPPATAWSSRPPSRRRKYGASCRSHCAGSA